MDQTKTALPNEYLKTRVLTAPPEQLQLMLYDGAIRFCEQARQAIEQRQVEQGYQLLCKAQKIVTELMVSLRDEYAPETCDNMRRLYLFCYERLTEANMKREIPPIDEALEVLKHIRETWSMLIDKLKQETAAAQPAPAATAPTAVPAGIPEAQQPTSTVTFEG